ncbi:hypothetical protein M426DRAFT_185050 [Hypoxylon sp. CI-4A]|nr:hypothetical protein M426DRAFT_185050 [Hypoxylon sp. CI-4A]
MADQCIVCLDNLDHNSSSPRSHLHAFEDDSLQSSSSSVADAPAQLSPKSPLDTTNSEQHIAVIETCGHTLHNACLREWIGKANSCPICRQTFHLVHVYDKVGGTQLSSYTVEDKKQVAEFDMQAWLNENPELEEERRSCPICDRSDQEDVLLLCDNCDAPYHTHCLGLESIPHGHWFCFECNHTGAELLAEELEEVENGSSHGSNYLPRTQATVRRARQQSRSNDWQGAWGQIAGRVWDVLNIDLDNYDDDEVLRDYRTTQQRREHEHREFQRWQQRFSIAGRAGAQDVFTRNISNVLPPPVVQQRPAPPPPAEESSAEKRAWGALEKAIEAADSERTTQNGRKRKSRSVTASPSEPAQQPERKLKRPRTRRVPDTAEPSSSSRSGTLTTQPASEGTSPVPTPNQQTNGEAPSFLSSLLNEVMSRHSDDENVRSRFNASKSGPDPSSPVSSPSLSALSSPRAMSATPPPRAINERASSPLTTLSSHIEPIYPPSNFLASLSNSDTSDSESRPRPQPRRGPCTRSRHGPLEIRRPRPQRQRPVVTNNNQSRSQETSPSRAALPFEMKESISGIVKDALNPYYKSKDITADQYASINRDLSHMLYKEVSNESLNNDARQRFERIATKEVAKAIAGMKA